MKLVVARIAIFVSCLTPVAVQASYWESFEGPLTSWKIVDADVRHQLVRHERVDEPVHSGAWSESITVNAGGGSFLHAAIDVPPVALIDELAVGLWVRADRPGMQLIARVVLPRSIDPQTNKPVTLLLHGSMYQAAGRWERLQLRGLPKLAARQARIARSENIHRAAESQASYDTREAYLDQIRINIYGGHGQTTVAVDDFEINGYVEVDPRQLEPRQLEPRQLEPRRIEPRRIEPRRLEPDGLPAVAKDMRTQREGISTANHVGPANRYRAAINPAIARVAWESSVLATEGKPLLPRIVQYHGEPLSHLRQLGFNAVWLDEPPSNALLQEAVSVGVWLICPAPSMNTPPFKEPLAPILSWHVGRDLSRRDLRLTAERVTHLRRIDGASRRPICAQVTSNLDAFSRHIDVLLLDRRTVDTTLDRESYFRWLALSTQMARPGATFWAMLHGRSPQTYSDQAAAFDPENIPSADADWQQLRTLALGSVAHGVRGLMFSSHARLDARDAETDRRAAQLELLNLELSLIEPWAAAGRFVTTVESNDPDVKAYVLQSDHTRLVLPIRTEGQTSSPTNTMRRSGSQSLRFVVPGVPDANRAYELTLGGLQPLNSTRVAGGKSVALDSAAVGSMIVLTSDPRVTGKLNSRLAKIRERAAVLTQAVATDLARQTDTTLRASGKIPAAVVQTPLANAARSLQEGHDHKQRGDFHGGIRAAHMALHAVSKARTASRSHFGVMQHPNTQFSFPLVNRFSALPVQAAASARLTQARWSANRLAGGDCENLAHMVQEGWRNAEFPQQGLTSNVELSVQLPHSGRTSLRLTATPAEGSHMPRLVESPPVWVTSGEVPVNAGDFVQIQGVVRVPRSLQGSVDELLVIDSIGGKELALRMGPAENWQRFVIYRAARQAGNVSVTFALSGVGEAWVDDVTIQSVGELPSTVNGPGLRFPAGPPATGLPATRTPPVVSGPSFPQQPPADNGLRFPTPTPRASPPAAQDGPVDPFIGVPL